MARDKRGRAAACETGVDVVPVPQFETRCLRHLVGEGPGYLTWRGSAKANVRPHAPTLRHATLPAADKVPQALHGSCVLDPRTHPQALRILSERR